jgi:hydroxymethylbilane synthase
MDKRKIRVATRKSPLAIRQTEMAISELQELRPDWEFEVIRMSTTGDDRLAWSLETTGGKGLFTSALEEAIVNHKADLAVHSAKDLPTEMPEGVALVGFLPRAPACDVLVVRESVEEPTLIATSSPRRRAQLKKLFPKAAWKEIRGNVQTRLTKVSEGFADATVMAKAGLYRLGIDSWDGLRFEPISITDSVPAAGQGAIGLQIRSEDWGHWPADPFGRLSPVRGPFVFRHRPFSAFGAAHPSRHGGWLPLSHGGARGVGHPARL